MRFIEPSNEKFDTDDHMVPPWIRFSDIENGSIGWKMGMSEQYCDEFSNWFCSQIRKVQVNVMEKYPEPSSWAGFYHETKS